MKRIKVLFLIHDLGGGGAEKVLVNLVNHMDKTVFEIHVTALFGGGINREYLSGDVSYRHVWSKPFPGNSRVLRQLPAGVLHRLCIKEQYDIEIAYMEDICAKIISGCENSETKTICWVHTDLLTREIAARGFRSIEESQKVFKQFDKIVCVSQTVKTDFTKWYPEVMEPSVLYNTLESEKILQMKDEKVPEKLFSADEVKLAFVGKINKQKGIDKVIDIIQRLTEDGLKVHLYILGEGPERLTVEKYIEDHQIKDAVSLLGYQENPYKYVSRCDLYVCASLWEGFSTAAMEALIVGTPVCTVEVSGMKEMLGENNEWGVITDNSEDSLYEGVKNLIEDPSQLQHYKIRATERGNSFTTAVTVKATEELFLRMIKH